MTRDDNKSPDPKKDKGEPNVPHFETMDFSASIDSEKPDAQSVPMDAYATQYVDRPMPSDETNAAIRKTAFPTDIPGFTVESELGRGAFGVVFCARDQMLDRRVAIKKPLISNQSQRQQYIDEARKAAKLDHPSIVPIYQVGVTNSGEPFVVLKLILGSTLRQMIQNGESRLPIARVLGMMRQVCLAVDAAHAAGIVHRDLKPENLLVEPEGRVYVADFGLAIQEDDENNKKGREVAGTPLYMSPEQFSGRVEWLDGRSDIWALGVILYELLSGKTPFSGSSLSELKDQIKNKDPRPIHQRDPKIPSAFDSVFRKCCAKTVGDRYASVRELIADLDIIAESLPMLDTVNMMSSSQTGAFKALSSQGSAIGSAIGSNVDASLGSVGSRSQNASGAGNSTVRNSFGGSTISQPGSIGKFVLPLLISTLLLGGLIGTAWLAKLGPFAAVELNNGGGIKVGGTNSGDTDSGDQRANGPESGGSKVVPKESELPGKSNAEQKAEPKLPLPNKPFRVSVDGSGTHKSIAKAISDSAAGDTIAILAGTYRESMVIDRSIKLIGQQGVQVLSTDGSCVKLQGDSQVSIEKVVFDSQSANFNTIDIYGGKLTLVQCDVFASSAESYDCVKVRANGTLVAEECKFESAVHAAVSGDSLSTIAIRDSSFSFAGNTGSDSKKIGIQASGTKGLIRNCVFTGPCIGGIDWKDSPDQDLIIEGCSFDNCKIGIQAQRCRTVIVKGSADQPCEIKNAVWGVSVKQSKVDLTRVNIEGILETNRMALQITERSTVNCTECNFSGYACGILVNQSALIVDRVETNSTSFVGLLVDGGSVTGKDLKLSEIVCYGLVVLSKGASVELESLKVDAVNAVQKIAPAVYVSSGSVEFKDGDFINCLCGVFVDPSRVLINQTRFPEKRSLLELIGDPDKIQTTLSPVHVLSDRMTLTRCNNSWVFNGIGSSKIKRIDGDLSEERRMPVLLDEDKDVDDDKDLKMTTTDLTNFSVIRKSGQ